MRKKKAVKEGSPFEEDYLLEVIKEEVVITSQEKEQVKQLMTVLMFFGMIDQATTLHALVEKIMMAAFESSLLMSVE